MKREYKVAFFSECLGKVPYGGPSVRHYNIVKILKDSGIYVRVFGTEVSKVHPDYDLGDIFSDHFDSKNFNIFWAEQSFKWIQKLNNLQILPILGSNIIPNSAPQHAIPYLDESGKQRQSQSIINEKRWVQQFKGKFWLSQSDFQEKEYRRLGVRYDIPVYRAYNPIDTNLFYSIKKKSSKFVIGYTGKINWAKSPWFLGEIAEALPEIEFHYFSDEQTNFTFPDNVKKILGNTNKQMPNLLRECDLFISTSVTENQALGILEAMACGIPVIAFRTSGIPEIIDHNKTGILVDLGNREHFIVEIKRILNGYYNLESISSCARNSVLHNYSNEECLKQYINIFDKYLEK